MFNKNEQGTTSTVSSVPNLSGASQFVYDEAGQLVKEIVGSASYEYAYDSKGNISSRETYSNGTLTKTDTFTYGADSWEDRLTGYGNKTITYDSIGNPTSYLGAALSWRGRELVGYEKGNKQISYSYDVDGMRYRKTVKTNGVETARYDYVYSDGKLILLTYTANGTSNTARFIYDSFGEPRGFILNNTASYIYLKNAQGDITAIADENGEVLLTYTYTAWGKVTYSATSMQSMLLAATLSNVNPFTYRGYCYDYDIGMYYLQSRYYDPEICRFINADSTDYLGATGTLLSYNLFAYCENEPVNLIDQNGEFAKWIYNKFKTFKNNIVGIGIQFECSASALGVSVGMGVEVIYFTHLKTIKVYAYSPKGIYFDKDDLSKLFNVAKKQLGKPQNLFKSSVSGSLSVSVVVIYSSKGEKFKTDDYLYDFKTYSFAIKHFQCFYSKGSDCIAIGAGGTISSSIVNVSASTSKSYYVYANQFFNYIYSSFQNCYKTIKNYANKAIINRK